MDSFIFYFSKDEQDKFEEIRENIMPLFDNGKFEDGDIHVDITTADESQYESWDFEGETPETSSPLVYGYIYTTAAFPITDFKKIQERIAVLSSFDNSDQFWNGVNNTRVERLIDGLRGVEIIEPYDSVPIPYIKVDSNGKLLPHQEGRHRTIAAEKVGLEKIPVKVLIDPDRTINMK